VPNGTERDRDILRPVPVHFSDETQRRVELRVVLPARILDTPHDAEEALAYLCRRANGDEQSMHGAPALA
jgi:hypothetical protein